MIREDDGRNALPYLIKFYLFFRARKNGVYARALFISIVFLLRAQRLRSPIWDTWERCLSCWNEESGELSLSQLARNTLSDTQKDSLLHMSGLYTLVSWKNDVYLKALPMRPPRASRFGQRVKVDDPMVNQVLVFVQQMITKLVEGKFQYYAGKPSDWVKPPVSKRGLAKDDCIDWSPSFNPGSFTKDMAEIIKSVGKSDLVHKVDAKVPAVPVEQFEEIGKFSLLSLLLCTGEIVDPDEVQLIEAESSDIDDDEAIDSDPEGRVSTKRKASDLPSSP